MESSACRGLERGANGKIGRKQNNAPCCFDDNNKRKKKTAHVGELIIIISFTAALKAEEALGENVRDMLLQLFYLLCVFSVSLFILVKFPSVWLFALSSCRRHTVQSQERRASN